MHRRLAVVAACLAAAALAAPAGATANSAPQCNNPPLSTPRNTDLVMQADCTDADGDQISYGIVSGPLNGTLVDLTPSGGAPYRPVPNYVGADAFTFSAHDGTATTNVTVSIQVVDGDGVNSAPVCPNPSYFVPTGSSISLTGNCFDADGDPVRYYLDSYPSSALGSLSVIPPDTVVFTAGQTLGTTTFTYHADDWQATSNQGTVTLEVVPQGGGQFSDGGSPSAPDPASAEVTTTQTGSVIVTQVATQGTAPAGLTYLPFQYAIEAPDGDPLTLRFTLDSTAVPAGHDENSIVVLRDGVAMGDCTGAGLGPDPCVSLRERLADGDVRLTVLSSHASTWNFAVPAQQTRRGKGCGDRNHRHERERECKTPAR